MQLLSVTNAVFSIGINIMAKHISFVGQGVRGGALGNNIYALLAGERERRWSK